VIRVAVEFWTEAEWAALAEHERPDGDTDGAVIWLPDVGIFFHRCVGKEESMEIAGVVSALQAYARGRDGN
jgi:hypothetical protein